jgi:hypothetical protein
MRGYNSWTAGAEKRQIGAHGRHRTEAGPAQAVLSSSSDQSAGPRSIIYPGTLAHEVWFALSSQAGEAGRSITNPKHESLCCSAGRPSFDTPAEELRVIDPVT